MDLCRIDVVLAGQLVDRPVGLVGRQGDLGLEPRRMNLALDPHWFPSSGPRLYLNHWSRKRGPLQPSESERWRRASIVDRPGRPTRWTRPPSGPGGRPATTV